MEWIKIIYSICKGFEMRRMSRTVLLDSFIEWFLFLYCDEFIWRPSQFDLYFGSVEPFSICRVENVEILENYEEIKSDEKMMITITKPNVFWYMSHSQCRVELKWWNNAKTIFFALLPPNTHNCGLNQWKLT